MICATIYLYFGCCVWVTVFRSLYLGCCVQVIVFGSLCFFQCVQVASQITGRSMELFFESLISLDRCMVFLRWWNCRGVWRGCDEGYDRGGYDRGVGQHASLSPGPAGRRTGGWFGHSKWVFFLLMLPNCSACDVWKQNLWKHSTFYCFGGHSVPTMKTKKCMASFFGSHFICAQRGVIFLSLWPSGHLWSKSGSQWEASEMGETLDTTCWQLFWSIIVSHCTILIASKFPVVGLCRRDALNFSHHRTTPKGIFDMTSLLSWVALHCPNLFIVHWLIEFLLLLSAFRKQSCDVCHQEETSQLLINVTSWSEMWELLILPGETCSTSGNK